MMPSRLLSGPALLLVLLCAVPHNRASAVDAGDWKYASADSVPQFPVGAQPRYGSAVAAVGNESKVMVHGGWGGANGNGYFEDLILLDLETNTTRVLAQNGTVPSARHYHGAQWVDDRFVICQGFNGGYLRDCWRYNQASANWTKLSNSSVSSLPEADAPATSVDMGSRFFLTFGGRSGASAASSYLNELWRVSVLGDGAADLVQNVSALPSGRRGSVLVRKGTADSFLLIGGQGIDGGIDVYLSEVYKLELNGLLANWSMVTALAPWNRTRGGVGFWDPRLGAAFFGFGFGAAASPNYANNMFVSDGTGENWTLLNTSGVLPTSRSFVGYASVELADGNISLFGFGGLGPGQVISSDSFLLQPGKDETANGYSTGTTSFIVTTGIANAATSSVATTAPASALTTSIAVTSSSTQSPTASTSATTSNSTGIVPVVIPSSASRHSGGLTLSTIQCLLFHAWLGKMAL